MKQNYINQNIQICRLMPIFWKRFSITRAACFITCNLNKINEQVHFNFKCYYWAFYSLTLYIHSLQPYSSYYFQIFRKMSPLFQSGSFATSSGVRHVGDSRMGRVPDIFCRSSNESTAYLILVIIRQQSPKQWGRISLAFSLSSGCVRCVKRFRCLSCPWKWRQHFWLISQKSSCSFDCIQILLKKRKLVAYYIFTYITHIWMGQTEEKITYQWFCFRFQIRYLFFSTQQQKDAKSSRKVQTQFFCFFFFLRCVVTNTLKILCTVKVKVSNRLNVFWSFCTFN